VNKEKFLEQLKKELRGLEISEKEDILNDYREHFSEAVKKGTSETEVIEKLGSPKRIAKELKAYNVVKEAENNISINNIFRLIITFFSLSIFNIILAFPFMFIVYLLIGFGLISVTLVFGGLIEFSIGLANIFSNSFFIAQDAGQSIVFALTTIIIGLILGIINIYLVKYFYKFTLNYIKMNIKIIKNEDAP
jgi:uncharacterized membrane protein